MGIRVAKSDGGQVQLHDAQRIHRAGRWHECAWSRTRTGWRCAVCDRDVAMPGVAR